MKDKRQRRIEAEERAAARAQRSTRQQLELVGSRRGESRREGQRLRRALQRGTA
jgi:hypothetical protein